MRCASLLRCFPTSPDAPISSQSASHRSGQTNGKVTPPGPSAVANAQKKSWTRKVRKSKAQNTAHVPAQRPSVLDVFDLLNSPAGNRRASSPATRGRRCHRTGNVVHPRQCALPGVGAGDAESWSKKIARSVLTLRATVNVCFRGTYRCLRTRAMPAIISRPRLAGSGTWL